MNKNLSAMESEQYMKIAKKGNMDDMFDFAYALGWRDKAKQMLEEMSKFQNEKS